VIEKAVNLYPNAATHWLSRRVAKRHPGAGIVEGGAYLFDPFAFAAAGSCTIEPRDDERARHHELERHDVRRPAGERHVHRPLGRHGIHAVLDLDAGP
jgi:hypothetical protein